jgi:hypothetical protein
VIRGSATGLLGANDPLWNQDYGLVLGVAAVGDDFGQELAAGYFNSDGYADLAIGNRWDDVPGFVNHGSVNILYGSANGLTDSPNDFWTQSILGEDIQVGEHFGESLAVGNFGQGPWDDLAIGVASDHVSGLGAGSVNVIFGSAVGLRQAGHQVWNQASPGIADAPETGDWFGGAVTAGDFNGDGYADLAIGAQDEDLGSAVNAGGVHVLKASAVGTGLISSGSVFLDQSLLGGARETNDWFGLSLSR